MPIVPTLNPNGWVNEPVSGMSEVLAMYFANKESQSNLFEVRSIAKDIAEFPDSPQGLAAKIRESLSTMYSAYFTEGAEVTTEVELVMEPYRNYRILVSVTCVADGKSYYLANTYQSYSGGFRKTLEKR